MDTESSALIATTLALIGALATIVGYIVYKAIAIFIDYFFRNPRLPGSKK